jgi:serine/threonine protein kinase
LYKAPEIYKDEKSSTSKVDLWALGIILFELTTKQQPIQKIIEISDPNPINIPSTLPPLIRTLVEKLLDKNPATRPSAEEILSYPEVIEAGNRLAK